MSAFCVLFKQFWPGREFGGVPNGLRRSGVPASTPPRRLRAVLATPGFRPALAAAADKSDSFGSMLARTFQHARIERDPLRRRRVAAKER